MARPTTAYPSRRLIALSATGFAGALLSVLFPVITVYIVIGVTGLGVYALIDFYAGRHAPGFRVQRHIALEVPVGIWNEAGLLIESDSDAQPSRQLILHEHLGEEIEVESMPVDTLIEAGRRQTVSYRYRIKSRGEHQLPGIDLIFNSPSGLWRIKRFIQLTDTVRCYPNYRSVSQLALMGADDQYSRIGVRRRRHHGQGGEFHQLRDYHPGDAMRQIDWKATARYRKPISKEYQDERDQQIVFVLDCGHRMRHIDDEISHFDQALNAILLLSMIANRQGDAIGLKAFGGDQRWLAPKKYRNSTRLLLQQTIDLQPTDQAADYLLMARDLYTQQKKRALIVIITNTRNEDQSDLKRAVHMLSTRHLVVVADLREIILDQSVTRTISGLQDALRFHAVSQYLAERQSNHRKLRSHGALSLDLLSSQLPAALVNQYLQIKSSGRL